MRMQYWWCHRSQRYRLWDILWYTTVSTMRLFPKLCFMCVSFILGEGCKGKGLIWGDREISRTGVHDMKLTENQLKVKKKVSCSKLGQWELVKARILSDKPPLWKTAQEPVCPWKKQHHTRAAVGVTKGTESCSLIFKYFPCGISFAGIKDARMKNLDSPWLQKVIEARKHGRDGVSARPWEATVKLSRLNLGCGTNPKTLEIQNCETSAKEELHRAELSENDLLQTAVLVGWSHLRN